MYEYPVKILSVVDGDTFVAEVDLGFYLRMVHRIRLKRCDAPEFITPQGLACRQFVANEISGATELKIQSHAFDKYGRLLVELFYRDKTSGLFWKNLSDVLLRAGLARRYSGGYRPWAESTAR
jgi:endonuclease YncB( thermonuclease family)